MKSYFELKGQVAVVIGASAGLGAIIFEMFI